MTERETERPSCRTLSVDDMPALRALLAEQMADPYVRRALELATLAANGSAEYHALVSSGSEEKLAGVGIYGLVAGAHAAGAIHSLVGRDSVVMRMLVDAILLSLRTMHARFAVVEIADEPLRTPLRAILLERGFDEESRVPDLYREGIALTFLRRDLESPS